MKAMRKDRTRRYRSASELSDDIQNYLSGAPLIAGPETAMYRTRKFVRKHAGSVAMVALVAVVIVLGLAVSTAMSFRAEKARGVAQEQRKRAEANLGLAMQILDEIYLAVVEKQLPQKPQIDQADRRLLQKALMFYEQFAAENKTAIESRYETAKAYLRVGEIRAMLGEHTEAEKAYSQAITLFKKLVADYPTVPEYRSDLVKALRGLSDVLSKTGQIPQAETYLRQAVDIDKKLVADFPNLPECRYQLSSTYRAMGLWLKETGGWEDAEKSLRQSVELADKLATECPDVHSYRGSLVMNRHQLGHILEDTGRHPEAEELYRQGLASLEKLTAEFADEVKYQDDFSRTYGCLGSILRETGRMAEAEQFYLQAEELLDKLVANFPSVPVYRAVLAANFGRLAALLKETGRLQDAEDDYRRSIEILEKLTVDFPTVTSYQDNLASNYLGLGDLLKDTARLDEAQEANQRALDIREKLVSENPAVTKNQSRLAGNYREMADIYLSAGYLNKAEEAYRHSLEISEKLTVDFPTVTTYQHELAGNYHRLGNLLMNTNRFKEAEALLRHALEIWEKLVSENPTVTRYRRGLCNTLDNLGRLLCYTPAPETGSLHEAEEACQRALEIMEQLVFENPTVTAYRHGLSSVSNTLAVIYGVTDRWHEKEAAYRWALAIVEKLLAENPSNADYQASQAAILHNLAVSLYEQGKRKEACQLLEEAISHSLAALTDPRLYNRREGLSYCHQHLAVFLRQLSENDKSEKVFRQAIQLSQELVEDFPEMPEAPRDLAMSHYGLGLLLRKTDRAEEAGKHFLEALKSLEKLVADCPNVPRFRVFLVRCLDQYGWYLATCADPKYADPNRVIELPEPTITNRLACMNNLAVLYMNQGRYDDAQSLLAKALQISRQSLGEQHASSLMCEHNLALAEIGPSRVRSHLAPQKAKLVIPPENVDISDEMQSCAENLRKIHAGIEEYKKDKRSLPDWLSDLVPDYLNADTLLCPIDTRHRAISNPDPNLPCSYGYQFSLNICDWDPSRSTLERDWKTQQVKLFGDVVPIVRCYCHGLEKNVLNLAVSGQIYWSHRGWEWMFQPDYWREMIHSFESKAPKSSMLGGAETPLGIGDVPTPNGKEVKPGKEE